MKNSNAQNSLKCKINIKKFTFFTNLRRGGWVCCLVQKTNFCQFFLKAPLSQTFWSVPNTPPSPLFLSIKPPKQTPLLLLPLLHISATPLPTLSTLLTYALVTFTCRPIFMLKLTKGSITPSWGKSLNGCVIFEIEIYFCSHT